MKKMISVALCLCMTLFFVTVTKAVEPLAVNNNSVIEKTLDEIYRELTENFGTYLEALDSVDKALMITDIALKMNTAADECRNLDVLLRDVEDKMMDDPNNPLIASIYTYIELMKQDLANEKWNKLRDKYFALEFSWTDLVSYRSISSAMSAIVDVYIKIGVNIAVDGQAMLIDHYRDMLGQIIEAYRVSGLYGKGQDVEDFIGEGKTLNSSEINSSLQKLEKTLDNDNYFEEAGRTTRPVDPLVLDISGEGLKTAELEQGTYFDLNNDGFRERTGWITDGSALLALDKNNDGTINNGNELFVDGATLQNGSVATSAFQVLAQYDSNNDGIIDTNDDIFERLIVWTDYNSNGLCETYEMYSMDDMGIISIAIPSSRARANINVQNSTYTNRRGEELLIGEFLFDNDPSDSIPVDNFIVENEEIESLPFIPHYGNVYNLYQAMAKDESGALKSLVNQFITATGKESRLEILDNLIYRWTGAATASVNGRGAYIDGRRLKAVEQFMGRNFIGAEGTANPNANAAVLLNQTYEDIREQCYQYLMMQTDLKELFNYIYPYTTELTIEKFVAILEADINNVKLIEPYLDALKYMGYEEDVDLLALMSAIGDVLMVGTGSAESPFELTTQEQFLYVDAAVETGARIKDVPAASASYVLGADINLSGVTSFKGIGMPGRPFAGTLDGAGHTVTLGINNTVESSVGLFRYTDGATIRNVSIAGGVKGVSSVGSIVGTSKNTVIEDCTSAASVSSSSQYLGGLVGYGDVGTQILRSENKGTVSSSQYTINYVGGIAGYVKGSRIEETVHSGVVEGNGYSSSVGTGGIVGMADANSEIVSCEVQGNVTGQTEVGGIAGKLQDSLVDGSKVAENVTVMSNRNTVGGITGVSYSSSIKNSEVAGQITGFENVAGITWKFTNSSTSKGAVIENCTASGNVTIKSGGNYRVSGIVGESSVSSYCTSKIVNTYFVGEKIEGISSSTEAFHSVHYNPASTLAIENSGYYVYANVAPEDASVVVNTTSWSEELIERNGSAMKIKIPVSKTSGGAIVNNTIDSVSFVKSGFTTQKRYVSENNAKVKYNFNFGDVVLEESSIESSINGTGSAESPFELATVEQFLYMESAIETGVKIKDVPAVSASYVLGADINLSGVTSFKGIGMPGRPFAGTLDGAGHTVTLGINNTVESSVGLFRYTDGATIRNVSIAGGVKGVSSVGSIVGTSKNTVIEDCTSAASVSSSSQYLGGLVGYGDVGTQILRSENKGTVSSSQYTINYVGGIAGYVKGSRIEETVHSGVVEGNGYSSSVGTGGIVGMADANSEIVSCEVQGNVTGQTEVGGIAGKLQDSLVDGSKVAENVTVMSNRNTVGGITGVSYSSSIKNSEVAGQITGFENVAGITWKFTNSSTSKGAVIENCTASGNVTIKSGGNYRVSGIVGESSVSSYCTSKIVNTYFVGEKIEGISSSTEAFHSVHYNPASTLAIENSGYYVYANVAPEDASVVVNTTSWSEELIERNGSAMKIKIPVSKTSGGAIVNNTIDSVSFVKSGFTTQKRYVSENNAKVKYNFNFGDVVLEESPFTITGITTETTDNGGRILASGAGIADATVTLHVLDTDEVEVAAYETTVTNQNGGGAWTIDGEFNLADGAYTAYISATAGDVVHNSFVYAFSKIAAVPILETPATEDSITIEGNIEGTPENAEKLPDDSGGEVGDEPTVPEPEIPDVAQEPNVPSDGDAGIGEGVADDGVLEPPRGDVSEETGGTDIVPPVAQPSSMPEVGNPGGNIEDTPTEQPQQEQAQQASEAQNLDDAA